MHELAITSSLVDCVCESIGGARVARVVVEIGKLSAIVPDAMRACFEVCAHDTPLEGATLDVVEVGGRARCTRCAAEFDIASLVAVCGCGSFDLEIVRGEELRLREVEVI